MIKVTKIDTLFMTKMAKKTIPYGAVETYTAHIREYPPPRVLLQRHVPGKLLRVYQRFHRRNSFFPAYKMFHNIKAVQYM